MKKCRQCTKPATLHITEIRNGESQALHLCEACAKEYLNSASIGSLTDEGGPVGGDLMPDAAAADEPNERDALTCPQCGISFKQFRGQGRLGCAHDYIVFREELLPLIESIHSETQHVGKVPRHAPGISHRQYELIRLRSELKAAVQNEKYEEAARLRDEIQQRENDVRQERNA